MVAIGVGRYHTALATASHVYTFGQNLGQLGYEKTYSTQILPKAVSTQLCLLHTDFVSSPVDILCLNCLVNTSN